MWQTSCVGVANELFVVFWRRFVRSLCSRCSFGTKTCYVSLRSFVRNHCASLLLLSLFQVCAKSIHCHVINTCCCNLWFVLLSFLNDKMLNICDCRTSVAGAATAPSTLAAQVARDLSQLHDDSLALRPSLLLVNNEFREFS